MPRLVHRCNALPSSVASAEKIRVRGQAWEEETIDILVARWLGVPDTNDVYRRPRGGLSQGLSNVRRRAAALAAALAFFLET